MKELVVAGRYAQALYDAAEAKGLTVEVYGELNMMAENLQQNPDFRLLLLGKMLNAAEKKELLVAVYGAFFQPLILNFLYLLIDKKREAILIEAIDAFTQLYRQSQGIEIATLISTKPLALAEEKELALSLKQAFNKDIIFQHKLDPALLGGVLIKIGDLMIDGSLKSRLRQIKEELRQAEIQPEQ
jgi:F-type H+-transporting ATPase subunit delta